ncbi:MAG: CtkA family protein [Defluviitaleaceae bacterium]|nr:CtkA family protein [Defluviitaleaceae bacterium]
MTMINFDEMPSKRIFYGGNAGAKEAIVYNGDVWMIKYPKTTRDMTNPKISYTTSPLSEYLGSKIYDRLNIPVHDVLLGVRKNKVVVACKDFTYPLNRDKDISLIPFHDLKNSFMSSDLEAYSGTGSETLLDEVLTTIHGEETLKTVDGVLERFWDMFVVDAFIGNNDRNNGNWGVLGDIDIVDWLLAPVYDNGNAFFNKRSLKQMEKRLNDKASLEQDAFKTLTCVYKYTGLDNEGHQINPFEFIKKKENKDCTNAVLRFLERVNMADIQALIEDIPESIGNLAVMPHVQKAFYLKLLQIRLEQFMLLN